MQEMIDSGTKKKASVITPTWCIAIIVTLSPSSASGRTPSRSRKPRSTAASSSPFIAERRRVTASSTLVSKSSSSADRGTPSASSRARANDTSFDVISVCNSGER
jgi:hypothetical protein